MDFEIIVDLEFNLQIGCDFSISPQIQRILISHGVVSVGHLEIGVHMYERNQTLSTTMFHFLWTITAQIRWAH